MRTAIAIYASTLVAIGALAGAAGASPCPLPTAAHRSPCLSCGNGHRC
jgi:hypothetical protein